MTVEHFETTFRALKSLNPFQPFTVDLTTGQRYEIDDPEGAAIHEGIAMFFAPRGVPVFFDHDRVSQIINSPKHSAPGKRRSK